MLVRVTGVPGTLFLTAMASVLKVFKDAFMRLLLPTTMEPYLSANRKHKEDHKEKIAELKEELEHVKEIVRLAQAKRSASLQRIWTDVSPKEGGGSLPTTPNEKLPQDAHLKDFVSDVSTVRQLVAHMELLETSIRDFEYVVNTQAIADLTGYRGLRDWARILRPSLDDICTAILTVSSVGTGLVYATVFSASRGNVSYMSFTFPLFSVGIIVPIIIQVALRWAAHLSHEVEFASQKVWTILIIIFLAFATACDMVAIGILNLTVYWLSFLPADAGVDTSGASGIAGIVAFALPGIIFIFIIAGFALGVSRNGIKAFRPTAGRHSDEIFDKADDYKHI